MAPPPDMVVSGVPQENGINHAGEIASMALDLVSVCHSFKIPHKPDTQLKIRAGIHSGADSSFEKITYYLKFEGSPITEYFLSASGTHFFFFL